MNRADIHAGFQQMNGEGVAQTVRGRDFWNGTTAASFLTGLLHGIRADVASRNVTREKPLLGLFRSPPVTEDFQQLRR